METNRDKMKILLVNAINERHPRDIVMKPLGLAYIASYLREYGYFTDIRITNGLKDTEERLKECPEVVAISSVSQNYNRAIEIANAVKKRWKIPVIMGGHHITALPSCLTSNMDIAVIGEGEQTILELMNLIEKDELDYLYTVDGVAYRENNKIITTKPRSQIKDLDTVPFPDRRLLNLNKNEIYMFTSRGCPAKCPYCSSSHFWKTVRYHSPEYVISEMKEIIKVYHPTGINIYDDLFIADKERLKRIVGLIEHEGINKKTSFSIQARVNFIDDETCQLLKRMNASVGCGFESGSPRTLRYLKGLDVKKNYDAISLFKRYNIPYFGSFMIGIPGETEDDMDMTIEFIQKSDLTGAEGYILTPFPNTPIWDYAKKKGLVSDNMNWDILDIDSDRNWKHAINLSDLSNERLHERFVLLRNTCEQRSMNTTIPNILNTNNIVPNIIKGIRNPVRAYSFLMNYAKFLTKKNNFGSK